MVTNISPRWGECWQIKKAEKEIEKLAEIFPHPIHGLSSEVTDTSPRWGGCWQIKKEEKETEKLAENSSQF